MSHNPNPYQTPYGQFSDKPFLPAPPAPKHSGLGIASFVVSLLSGALLFAMIGVATYFAATQQGEFDETSGPAIAVGLGIIAGMGLAVIGAALGVAGLAQANRNKVFAILGLTFNALAIVAVCGIMALGLAAG